MLHKSRVQHTRPGHDANTPDAAPGAVGVGEHNEEVADREVDLIARKYEKKLKNPSKKTEERSQHTFSSIVLTVCVITRVLPAYYPRAYLLRSSALLTSSSKRHPFSCSSPPNVTLTIEISRNTTETGRGRCKQRNNGKDSSGLRLRCWVEIAVFGFRLRCRGESAGVRVLG